MLRLSLPELCPDERVTKPFWTTAGSICCLPLPPSALEEPSSLGVSCCAEASSPSAQAYFGEALEGPSVALCPSQSLKARGIVTRTYVTHITCLLTRAHLLL